MEQGFPTLLPYYKYKDSKRYQNLQVNDVCLIKYETKVASTYRLCRVSKLMHSEEGIVRTVEVQLGNRKLSKKNPPVKNLVTAVQRLVLLVPADELEQGPPKPRGRPLQKGFADDHLPAQVGSSAPILGEGQEQKKEEVLPGFSRCRPEGRVADPGPMAKVSHHFMLLEPKMMPHPSLKFCHPMCGPTSEPKLTPHLGPDINSSNPDELEPRGWSNQGLAGDQGQSRLQQMSLHLRA